MNDTPAENPPVAPPVPSYRRTLVLVCVLLCSAWLCLVYVLRERRYAARLERQNAELDRSLSRMRGDLDRATAKLNAASATEVSSPAAAAVKRRPAAASRRPAARAAAQEENPHWAELQTELAGQQKRIAAAEQGLEKTRTELAAELSSTRQDLSGSIARNHEELVALEKRSARSFYEFDLTRSKEFRRAGPISVSLRKADTRRQYCDLEILVDDVRLTRKHVNLYEPVLLYPDGYAEAMELVINQIEKNESRGYVSEPKYRMATPAAAASDSTVSLERRPGAEP